MKVGDRVKVKNYQDPSSPSIYTVLEIDEKSVKLKHPDVEGYFIFSKEVIIGVVNEDR